MNRIELSDKLISAHTDFIQFLGSLGEEAFSFSAAEKWNAGQQLDHIARSVTPVNNAMDLPDDFLREKFGEAGRVSRTFEELVQYYQQKLAEGGKASGPFVPPPAIAFADRTALLENLRGTVSALSEKITKSTEEKLDRYQLPHPLLGMLTIREMLYFTTYHVTHHQHSVQNALLQR